MSKPTHFLGLDPGRHMGWGFCRFGGINVQHGTWKFDEKSHGAAYTSFRNRIVTIADKFPGILIGIELMTIVPREDDKGRWQVNAPQIEFSSGWPAILKQVCHEKGLTDPEEVAISSWRSRTHGKTRVPKGYAGKSDAFFKKAALDYCQKQGWSPGSHNAAEALGIMDYLRILHEPSFAFEKGASHQQESLSL